MKLDEFMATGNFNRKIAIYVPSTVSVNVKADTSAWIEKTAVLLSDCFGGCTQVRATGNWISKNKTLVNEDVTIVYAFCNSSDLELFFSKIYAHVVDMRDSLSQEAISVEIDSRLFFV